MSENISSADLATSPPATQQRTVDAREQITVIAPRPGWRALNVREMWAYRELLLFLIWRDIKVRYKQTLLGVAWSVLQPVMYSIVFAVVFSRIGHAPSEGLPYLLFAFSGLVLWFFFSTAITQAGNSVIGSEALITKVYFPRLAIPFAAVGAALFDFVVTLFVLVPMIIYFKYFTAEESVIAFTWQLVLLPGLVFLTILAALGVGTFLAALNVSFRDFKHTIPFLVQLWLFATPAIYMGIEHQQVHRPPLPDGTPHSSTAPAQGAAAERFGHPLASTHAQPKASTGKHDGIHPSGSPKPAALSGGKGSVEGAVPDWIQGLLKFNPLTGLVRSFRAAALGQPMPWNHLAYSAVIVVAAFLGGCFYFHRVEDAFADII